jgi:acid phosphatase type 7
MAAERTSWLLRSRVIAAAAIVTATITWSCGAITDGGGPSSPSSIIGVIDNTSAGVLVGAGDIANCNNTGAHATAKLLDAIQGTVFVAGDNAYPTGAAADYRDCYDPTWGRHRARTRPVPGNHEYQTPGASGYFDYFGASAGSVGLGYYSYAVGPWLVLAINSEIPSSSGSPQYQWVSDELTRNPRPCTAVIWHRPLFSSGRNGANRDMQDLWRLLYQLNVEIVINGHDHIYERFAPQTADGVLDAQRGVRQFTVGTGGAPATALARTAANSESAANVLGVAKFTLQNGAYRWEFIPADGETFRDAGAGTCH